MEGASFPWPSIRSTGDSRRPLGIGALFVLFALATLGDEALELATGDALVVPAGVSFALASPHDDVFRAVVALPIGGKAAMPDGEPFVPPWAA